MIMDKPKLLIWDEFAELDKSKVFASMDILKSIQGIKVSTITAKNGNTYTTITKR